ncbi:hypothetical protein HQ403_03175 [Candidatus Kaiserbacteria bacterium]|nr:hypothetical protein [Candidatus Kaiserbacteria bacterium]
MIRITLKDLVAKEIDMLNTRIDKKIVSGKSYYRDAQKHHALVVQYRRIELREKMNISFGSMQMT